MLLTLSMRNVALIESLTLEFQRGLHVMRPARASPLWWMR